MEKQLAWFDSDLPSGADYTTERRVIRAGEYFPPHWHDYFELELVLSGEGEQVYNRQKCRLGRGSATLMTYYDFHEFRAGSEMELLKIQFNGRALPEELTRALLLCPKRFCFLLEEEGIAKATAYWEQLHAESPARDAFSGILARGSLASLAVLFLRQAGGGGAASAQPLPLQKAVAAVHTRFREELTLGRLAVECAVTPNYLGALFSHRLGVSFSEYLNTVRLRHACDLLIGTDLTAKEIAFASGYGSAEYFQFVFRKKLSRTPQTFRREAAKN